MKATQLTGTPKMFWGIGICSALLLLYQILLTRLFSVMTWNHFAFVAISSAMFGLTVGALGVYLNPQLFKGAKLYEQLQVHSILSGLTMVTALVYLLALSSIYNIFGTLTFTLLTFLVISLPFIFGGVIITLILTHFTKQISGLYAADLTGAALGCGTLLLL